VSTVYPKSTTSGIFVSFSHPNFRLWFSGQLVSLVGTWMQSTAQGYLIYVLTGSSAYLGYIALASGIPTWFFTLYGGVIADRISRRTLLVITQSAMMVLAFILSALVFTNTVKPWHILVLAFLLGVTTAFDAPARQSFVRELVSREHMVNAIALNSAMFNLGTVVGPAIAGLTYAAIGAAWCFSINGVSFIAVIIALLVMKIDQQIVKPDKRSALIELKEGVAYVKNNKIIRSLILNLAFLSVFGAGVIALIPAWAVEVLKGDVRLNGWLLSARGTGALMGTLLIAYIGNRKVRGNLWAFGNLAMPVLWIVFSFITKVPLSLIIAVFIGLTFVISVNLTNVMIQTEVTDELRGRVMAIYTLTFFGLTPIGSLLAGVFAEKFGEQITVLSSGIILLVLAIFTALRMPYLRKVD
jgi:predicted MFS family arabinose efflux permease